MLLWWLTMKKHQALQTHWTPFVQYAGARRIVNARRNKPDMGLAASTNSKRIKSTDNWPQSIRAAKATRIYKLYRGYIHVMLRFILRPCRDPQLSMIQHLSYTQNEKKILLLATSLIWRRGGQCLHRSRRDHTSMSQSWPKTNRISGRSTRVALLWL